MDFFGYRKLKPESEWDWVEMHLPGSRKDKDLLYKVFFGKKIKAPEGRRWALSQEALDDAISRGLVKINEKTGMPKFLTKWETLGSNWMDIQGYSKYFDYPTENSEVLLERVIKSAKTCKRNDYNLGPSRYVGDGQAEEYRDVEEILVELAGIEDERVKTDKELNGILKKIGYKGFLG